MAFLAQLAGVSLTIPRVEVARGSLCRRNEARCHPQRAAQHTVVKTSSGASAPEATPVKDVAVILLAGGVGKRMKADRPKQFLQLMGKPVVIRSLELFLTMPEVNQIVIVVENSFRDVFTAACDSAPGRIAFADPGSERQDSVFNGLQMVTQSASLVCVHDSARPLVTQANVRKVLCDAQAHGAAVLGVPSKATIKESADSEFVLRTIERSRLWEVQTPQVVKPSILRRGFAKVREQNLAVTDDVSLVEQLGEPVKLTLGEYTNIKLTTPEDMDVANSILQARGNE